MKYKLLDTNNWEVIQEIDFDDPKTIKILNLGYATNGSPLRWYSSDEVEDLDSTLQ